MADSDSTPHLDLELNAASAEARERLEAIMSHDIAEAIEQIGQTLEACQMKKNLMFERFDQVYQAVEAVRSEYSGFDTTIASKVLHLNQLMTQIVQQMARIRIPDPPPPPPLEPLPPPTVEIDLAPVHERLNHMANDLTKLILEKEETLVYVINKRPGSGDIATSVHTPIRMRGTSRDREDELQDQVNKLQSLVRGIQQEDQHPSKAIREESLRLRHHSRRSKHLTDDLPPFDYEDETNFTNGQGSYHGHSFDDETSRSSDQTTLGPSAVYIQDRTDELMNKPIHASQSIVSSHYTEPSRSAGTNSVRARTKALGQALASNGHDIAYYDYEQKAICVVGDEEYSIKFDNGLVVDLYWWPINDEWLILSEQGLYRWKPTENSYQPAYVFSNSEIGFRRIAVTSTGIFCLFRYSVMIVEFNSEMQMKHLHALAPLRADYDKLGDLSVRKFVQSDGSEEDVLGLIWFGAGSGVLIEERFANSLANNNLGRLFRHVPVRHGRYARLASYDNGRAWLISNTSTNVFWLIDSANLSTGRWDAKAIYVRVNGGTPINAVGCRDSTICIRLEDGKLEYLASAQ